MTQAIPNKTWTSIGLVLAALSACACSDHSHDLKGDGLPESLRPSCSDDDLAASGRAALDSRNDLLREGAAIGAFRGTWRGEIPTPEYYVGDAERASVPVVLELSADGRGSLTVGSGAALQPTSEPESGYPPAVDVPPEGGPLVRVYGGFPYSVYAVQVSGDESLEFFFALEELYADWCALQTPQANRDNCSYDILPEHEQMRSSDAGCTLLTDTGALAVDCVRYGLHAEFVCTCDAAACAFNPTPAAARLSLDAKGTELTGTVQRLGVDSVLLLAEAPGD